VWGIVEPVCTRELHIAITVRYSYF
jgi:hypothetical protein